MSAPYRVPPELERKAAALIVENGNPDNQSAQGSRSTQTKPTRGVTLTSEEELEALEPVPFLVDGILPEQSLGVVFGESETYKSFVMLSMLVCIALGIDFHGHQTKRGVVLYVAAEGFFGMRSRYLALKQYLGFSGSIGIHFLRHSIDLRKGSRDVRELLAAIEERIGERIAVIVIDTLGRNFIGNENAPEDMGEYIRGCEERKEATGAAIISIHHSGYATAERSRGHSSLRGALDVEIKCTRDGSDRVTLECTKMKDAPHFSPMRFDMLPMAGSLVPKEVGTADVRLTDNRARALAALPNQDGLTRKQWREASGLPEGTLRHIIDWCLQMSYVRQVRDAKYVRNEAGSAALLPRCQSTAT